MILKSILINYLRESADKLAKDECALDDVEIAELAGNLLHVKVNKTQAAKLLNISTRTFDRHIETGELPAGRKDLGSNQLYWFKDELYGNIIRNNTQQQ